MTWTPIVALMVGKRHCVVWTTVGGESVSVKSEVSPIPEEQLTTFPIIIGCASTLVPGKT